MSEIVTVESAFADVKLRLRANVDVLRLLPGWEKAVEFCDRFLTGDVDIDSDADFNRLQTLPEVQIHVVLCVRQIQRFINDGHPVALYGYGAIYYNDNLHADVFRQVPEDMFEAAMTSWSATVYKDETPPKYDPPEYETSSGVIHPPWPKGSV